MAKYCLWALAMAIITLCSIASIYMPFFSDFSGLDSSGNTLHGVIPEVIEAEMEGTGYPASRILPGRRMMSSTHQESKYREPVRPSHSSDPSSHSDPGNGPGKPNL